VTGDSYPVAYLITMMVQEPQTTSTD